jgi:hypothetical protein
VTSFTMLAPRVATGAAGFAIGATCALMAFRNGQGTAPGLEGALWASAYASAVVGSWFLPSVARTSPRGYALAAWLLFLIATAFVLINAIGYTAKHRDSGVGAARDEIHAHDIAQREYDRLSGELDAMKPNPRWIKTSGCTDITVPQSDKYCEGVRKVRGELAKQQAILARPKPLSADPQAERLSMVLTAAPETVADWLPIFVAVAMDLLASGLISMAFAPMRVAPNQPAPLALAEPAWLSASPIDGKRLRQAKVFDFAIDGRKLRHLPKRAANS